MKYKGISYSNTKDKWYAKTRFEGKVKVIGEFDTPEEASEAYINFKQNVKRELTDYDLHRLDKYKKYVEFCAETKTMSEFFAEFKSSGSSSVRGLVNYLVYNGFIKQKKISKGINTKDIYTFTKIKSFSEDRFVPRATSRALTENYVITEKEVKKITGGRIIHFDEDKELCRKYKEQREEDRKNAKARKVNIAGSSLLSVFW